jgi:hypothetical protein
VTPLFADDCTMMIEHPTIRNKEGANHLSDTFSTCEGVCRADTVLRVCACAPFAFIRVAHCALC